MKIICFFNWNLGYLTLSNLLQSEIEIFAVVTNYDLEDRNDIYRNKVYELATENGITVYKSYKDVMDKLSTGMLGFSVAYGNEIFKKDILSKIPIYNFHPSCLPLYKGPSPIEWQIKEGVSEIGMSCHEVIEEIDSGDIISQKRFSLDFEQTFNHFLGDVDYEFAQYIFQTIDKIIKQKGIISDKRKNEQTKYYHKITIPSVMRDEKISVIREYLNRKRVIFFAGNRAELGILMPLIIEFEKKYYVDLMVSESYFQNGGRDYNRIKETLNRQTRCVNLFTISQKTISYENSLSDIYESVYKYLSKQNNYQYQYAIVLGDRIEAMAFSLAVFYSKVPLIHVGGGDIGNVPYFDTNIRHCISKLASLHFTLSDESKRTLCQLGEEEARIINIGNPTFDYKRLGLLLTCDQLENEFRVISGKIVIFTYHACPFYDEDKNLEDFLNSLNGVIESRAKKIIITYPNYDPGSKKILLYLKGMSSSDRITVHESLGTVRLDSIMNNGNCIVVGNSSSGLLETLFYKVPSINIGSRQTDRMRGDNVYDVPPEKIKVKECINFIIDDYEDIVERICKAEQIFGDGNAGIKARDFLNQYDNLARNDIITKNFIKRHMIDE